MRCACDFDSRCSILIVLALQRKDSNSLVEEFMLLANMAVAEEIEKSFPETALLRCHPPPKQKVRLSMIVLKLN